MAVPGQGSVDQNGNFNYTIPIAVPPGTAGIVPQLALVYNSGAGDGFEGLGWNLAGLPAITRCPKTVATNGTHGGVNFDSNDRFCLGGQQLIAISGTYGANGTEYRTEVDTFTKIISEGSAGTGPSWFKAWTKSGRVIEFGNSTDSKIYPEKADGSGTLTTVGTWAANKISDRAGNYLSVIYTNDSTNGQFYPTEIDYTANDAASLLPYASVKFVYSSRNNITPQYQAGTVSKLTKILSDIKTLVGSTLVSDYQLGYIAVTDGTARRYKLQTVTRCDNSGNCLAPTTFTWQGSDINPPLTANPISLAQGTAAPVAGNFDGDGLIDVLIYASTCPTYGQIYNSTQSGSFVNAQMKAHYTWWDPETKNPVPFINYVCFQNEDSTVGDFTGDGLSDLGINIQMWQTSTSTWVPTTETLENDGAGMLTQINGNYTYPFVLKNGLFSLFSTDFNGDGRGDAFAQTSSSMGYAYIAQPSGSFISDSGHSGLGTSAAFIIPADFDGDGCDDMLAGNPTNAVVQFCNTATPTASTPNWSGDQVITGDFNGDGKVDVLTIGTGQKLWFSTGTGFVSSSYTVPPGWSGFQIVTGDFNGDGKTDLALIGNGVAHQIWFSTGNGFVEYGTITNTTTSVVATVGDWNNDGASDLWLQKSANDKQELFGYVPAMIASVDNGIGLVTNVTYDRINKNGTFYTKDTDAAYPAQDMDRPLYAVSQLAAGNGIGGNYLLNYSYAGAKTNLEGRGFLGFRKVIVNDPQTGIAQTTVYRQDFPFIGLVDTQTRVHGSITLSELFNTYAAKPTCDSGLPSSAPYIVYVCEAKLGQRHDLDSSALPDIDNTYADFTDYADPKTVTLTVSGAGGGTETRVSSYLYDSGTGGNDPSNWVIGHITHAHVEATYATTGTITRVDSFQYDSATGLLTEHTVEPVTAPTRIVTDYTRAPHTGLVTQVSVSGDTFATRDTQIAYDDNKRLPVSVTNALNQTTTYDYIYRFGEPTQITDPNGVITQWAYDGFGRVITQTNPDGTTVNTTYAICNGYTGGTISCFDNQSFRVQTTVMAADGTTQIAPTISAFYDALSRFRMTNSDGFDGSTVRTLTAYDADGNVASTSRPYYPASQSAANTTYTYDDLNRVTRADFPDTSHSTYAYSGLSSTVTNYILGGGNQATTTLLNNLGLPDTVTDALSQATHYGYDGFGDLLTAKDPAGNTITNTWDKRGRKTESGDPDMGDWTYSYDALSELTEQIDAKSQHTTLGYDLLGRATQRTEPGLTSTWAWDTATNGVGKLAEASTSADYDRAYTYDGKGRPSGITLTIGGMAYPAYSYHYDSNSGKLSYVTRPSGLSLYYDYNSTGYLCRIADGASATCASAGTAQSFWRANALDAEMHVTQETLGNSLINEYQTFDADTGRIGSICATTAGGTCNGALANLSYIWDSLGNLSSRADANQSWTENFCYDGLNRVQNVNFGVSCTGTGHVNFTYGDEGNLASQTGVGTYTYGGMAGPHAVTSITGTVNGVTNPTFAYDGNGNMTSGAGRTLTYTPFNMALTITDGASSLALVYDSEHNRIQQCARDCTSPTTTTNYLNDPVTGELEEKVVTASATVWSDYISAPGAGLVALRSLNGATVTINYLITDSLGSPSTITDATGTTVQTRSYGAFGQQRNANGTPDTNCSLPGTSPITRGYTSQEEMPSVCLINMNARLYDPQVGRFMSADSIVPDPFDGQSMNRFSYVNNNPLNAIDPAGQTDCNVDGKACYYYVNCITCAGVTTPPIPDACGANPCPTGPAGGLYSALGFSGFGTDGGLSSGESGAGNGGGNGNNGQNSKSQSAICKGAGSAASGMAGTLTSTGEAIAGTGEVGVAAEGATLAELIAAAGPAAAIIAPLALLSSDTRRQDQEYVYHYTNETGHTAIDVSGTILPGPSTGYVFVTTTVFGSGAAAQQALALNKTPTGYYQIPSSDISPAGPPSPVPPANGQPGGGAEIKVPHPVPVSCGQWRPIGP